MSLPQVGSAGAQVPHTTAKQDGISFLASLVCVTLIGIALRPALASIGPLIVTIRDRFALSNAEAALLTTIPNVLMGLMAVPAPWLARRFGRDQVILASLILLLLATVIRAFSASPLALLLSTAAVGTGIAVAGALIGGFIKAISPGRAAQLVGVYAAALAFGATLAAGLSGPLAAWGGWRFGSGIWALPVVVALAAWLYVERRHRATAAPGLRRHRLPIGSGKAWLIGLYFGADNFLFYGLLSWIAPIYREWGISETTAGLILASFTGCFLVINPIAGSLSRSTDRRVLLAGFAAIILIGLIALALAPGAMPFLIISVISLGIGGGFTLGMTLPLDNTRDSDEANAWSAFGILVAYLIAATGPLLVGWLRDLTGHFTASLWLLIAVSVAMLALTPFLQPNPTDAP